MKVLVLLCCQLPLVLAQTSSPSPTQGDMWGVECDPSSPDPVYLSPLISTPEEPRPINETLVFILLLSRTAVRICDELMHKAEYELNKTGDVVPEKGSSPLDMLPLEKGKGGNMKTKSILTRAAGKLSRVGVFLDVAMNDTVEYGRKLRGLNWKLTEIFCEMYHVMTRLTPEVDQSIRVSRDIMNPRFKDLDDVARHKRNYFTIKRARQLFSNFIDALQGVTNFKMGPNYEILK